jgi:glycosyltransferase involved in cell wall biosynthesis
MSVASIDIVIPTIGRDSLAALLGSIGRARGRRPERIILADDRAARGVPLDLGSLDPDLRARIAIVPAGGHGPAAARNVGWRAARAAWVVFLDDDVVVDDDWLERLEADLASAAPDVAASYGRVRVAPRGSPPTARFAASTCRLPAVSTSASRAHIGRIPISPYARSRAAAA